MKLFIYPVMIGNNCRCGKDLKASLSIQRFINCMPMHEMRSIYQAGVLNLTSVH